MNCLGTAVTGYMKLYNFIQIISLYLHLISTHTLSRAADFTSIGLLPWSGAAYLALLLFTFVSSVVLSIVLRACDPFAHLNRVFSWSRLLVPPLSRAVLFPWWVPRSGMGSLLNFGSSLELCHLRFFLNLRLLFLAVLESGAPLSSSFEEALYKCSV